ncbi:MAG: dockerin type I repeat-containing protein [Candidatus Zixiibacteriota bacterium]|nr:MAG: dockerin type I repeat-containing protein [candidate division Zixibacteria bacterium]
MRKTGVVFLAVGLGLLLPIGGPAGAQSDVDHSEVTWLRWMDPYRDPITYQEYRQSREFDQSLDARLIYAGNKGDTPVCIVINNLLHFTIQSSFSVFISDLEIDGYSPNVYTAYNNGDEVALKDILISEWNSRGVAGAILIGDLPVPWYEMTHPPEYGGNHVEFPIDLYFMDLDGRWLDRDFDELYDGHDNGSGDMEADIWVGRLLAMNLTDHGASEAVMMNNYLDKNHRYRTGELRLQDKALAYVDNDWCTYGYEEEVTLAYPVTDMVTDPYETTREDYMQRVRQSTGNQYENLLICSHSTPWAHYLYWGTEPYDYSLFHNHEIEQIDVQVFFYNLFACSNARYVEEDDMGNWYIFQSTYGLLAVGSTKSGAMLCFDDYYGPLGDGLSFGEAFLFWCQNNMESCYAPYSRVWFYGMTLLGDPTLKLSRFMPDNTGDANSDGAIDLGDVVFLINYLFRGGTAPDPLRLGDPTADCLVDVGDVIFLLNYLYRDGLPPGIGCE